MAGARSLHVRNHLDPVPDAFSTARWGLQSKQYRSMPHEEVLGDTLGEYVRRVVPGGDAREQDGEAGDSQTDHAIPRGHPARW